MPRGKRSKKKTKKPLTGKPNRFEENRRVAAAKHGSLYNPLHIKNDKRKDQIDHVYIEKDYHSGGKYIRQLNAKTGKTVSFLYETAKGYVFYQQCEPERKRIYHSRTTGKKTTVMLATGERWTEYLEPNVKTAEEKENEGVHSFLDPEMAQLEKRLARK